MIRTSLGPTFMYWCAQIANATTSKASATPPPITRTKPSVLIAGLPPHRCLFVSELVPRELDRAAVPGRAGFLQVPGRLLHFHRVLEAQEAAPGQVLPDAYRKGGLVGTGKDC